jgi:hypothetical protein
MVQDKWITPKRSYHTYPSANPQPLFFLIRDFKKTEALALKLPFNTLQPQDRMAINKPMTKMLKRLSKFQTF